MTVLIHSTAVSTTGIILNERELRMERDRAGLLLGWLYENRLLLGWEVERGSLGFPLTAYLYPTLRTCRVSLVPVPYFLCQVLKVA